MACGRLFVLAQPAYRDWETETEFGDQPLGDIAAIGRGGKPLNNGHVHYQCEEPGYIIGLMAITPMVDYSQGNDFDLNLQTIDDLHKPALDGIGYQDLIQEQMVGETSVYEGGSSLNNIKHLAANKTVAWIDYMTNYNRTGIGMKMSDIKIPMMLAQTYGSASEAKTNISPSALYKYLGLSKARRTGTSATQGIQKNGVPLLMYLDIFKNFFANTQEKSFYMLKGIDNKIDISGTKYNVPFSNEFIEISDKIS